jgi:hypothetical protein
MPTDATSPDPLDELLAAHYNALVTDLTTTLDLDAGLTEALQPRHFTNLTAHLHTRLDLDAGLAAILDPTPLPDADLPRPSEEGSWLTQLVELLGSLDAPTRLRLRARPDFITLISQAHFAPALDLDLTRALDRALAHALDLTRARNLTRDRARDLTLDLTLALDLARDLDLNLARDLACDLACDLAHARALDRDLDRNRARDRDLALARDLARNLDLDLDRARARDLARDLDLARILDAVLADIRDRALDLAESLELNRAWGDPDVPTVQQVRELGAHLKRLAEDFTGADLSRADLSTTNLEGVLWSSATRWPTGWVGRIHAESVDLGDGTFRVVGRGQPDREFADR